MNIKEAAQYFLESHKTFKKDQIAWGKDQLEQAIEHLENNGNSDPYLTSADTYLEIRGFDSVSGNPVIVEWYEHGEPTPFFMLDTTRVWGGQYQYETDIFDDYNEALEAAKLYLFNPIRLNEHCDYEPSFSLCEKQPDYGFEDIDLYAELNLDKEQILKQANLLDIRTEIEALGGDSDHLKEYGHLSAEEWDNLLVGFPQSKEDEVHIFAKLFPKSTTPPIKHFN